LLQPVDIVVAPWHGWRPLEDARLLTQTQARYILFSTRHKNRYDYPRPETLMTYSAHGGQILNTADEGAIEFILGSNKPLQARSFRHENRRYWHTP
jgi:competence protein ComEC